MKKWWAFLIVQVFALILLSPNVFAAQAVSEVSSALTLRTELKKISGEGKIILKTDINANQELVVNAGSDVTLDLNGRTLSIARYAIQVEGSLTIIDSVGGGELVSEEDAIVQVLDGGAFTLRSGSITAEGDTAVELDYKSDAEFNMAGGCISARSEAITVNDGSVNISAGEINTDGGGIAINASHSSSPVSITIGAGGGEHGEIYISGISASEECSLYIYSGIVGYIQGVGQGAVLNCLFEQDVSSSLPSGWTCAPIEYAGKLYYCATTLDEETAAARIGEIYYADAATAARDLDDDQTLVLLQDVKANAPGQAILEINAVDPTVDLNGCDITNTGAEGTAISMTAADGSTARIVNSVGNAEITAEVPLRFAGTSQHEPAQAEIVGRIALETYGKTPVELDDALLVYSRDAAAAIANGWFAAETDSGVFVFSNADEAILHSNNGSAVLLNDYSGSEQISILSGEAYIDLAGHTYTVSGTNAVLTSGGNASLTVMNGKVVGGAAVQLGASLKLDGVEVSGEVSASGIGTELMLIGCKVEDQGVGVLFNTQGGSLSMDSCDIAADPALRALGGTARIFGDSVLSAAGNSAAISIEGGTVLIEDGLFVSEHGAALSVSAGTATVYGGGFSSPVSAENLAGHIKAMCCSPSGLYSYYSDVNSAELAEPESVVSDISCATGGMCCVIFTGEALSQLPGSMTVPAGAYVKLPEAEREDWFFAGWDDGECVYDAEEIFAVTADTRLTAVWSETDPDAFNVTVAATEHGTVKTDVESARAGDTVTVTVEPEPGYILEKITVDGVELDGTSFKMPEHDVEVSATFISEYLAFDDVRPWDWFYDSVVYACTNGLMNGISGSEFAPNSTMTRAMFWTVLARIDGVDTDGGKLWYSKAQMWAVVSDVSDGTMPNELITREQLATMLWRYSGCPNADGDLSNFTDADSASDWAREALAWAVDSGIIEGITETTLSPGGNATRAQAATMFMRFTMLQK